MGCTCLRSPCFVGMASRMRDFRAKEHWGPLIRGACNTISFASATPEQKKEWHVAKCLCLIYAHNVTRTRSNWGAGVRSWPVSGDIPTGETREREGNWDIEYMHKIGMLISDGMIGPMWGTDTEIYSFSSGKTSLYLTWTPGIHKHIYIYIYIYIYICVQRKGGLRNTYQDTAMKM